MCLKIADLVISIFTWIWEMLGQIPSGSSRRNLTQTCHVLVEIDRSYVYVKLLIPLLTPDIYENISWLPLWCSAGLPFNGNQGAKSRASYLIYVGHRR